MVVAISVVRGALTRVDQRDEVIPVKAASDADGVLSQRIGLID